MDSAVRRLGPTDYRTMPWKNGGGVTTELAVEPAGGAAFTWRVSLATLAGPGPFSAFDGYDRVIVQTKGPALTLEHGTEGKHTLTPLVPYRFKGEWKTNGVMAVGDGQDFNVMTKRGEAAAYVEVVRLAAGEEVRKEIDADVALVHVVAGEVILSAVRAEANETIVAKGEDARAFTLGAASSLTALAVWIRAGASGR